MNANSLKRFKSPRLIALSRMWESTTRLILQFRALPLSERVLTAAEAEQCELAIKTEFLCAVNHMAEIYTEEERAGLAFFLEANLDEADLATYLRYQDEAIAQLTR